MPEFELDPRLAADGTALIDWPLTRVILKDDQRFPWLILVPRRPGLTEWFDLDAGERFEADREIVAAARTLKSLARIEKINIATLGNIVRQLHIHVVARHAADPAWPGPVWGYNGGGGPHTYPMGERLLLEAKLTHALTKALS